MTLLDTLPVLQPMEQVRTVFPNAMHVRRDLQKNISHKEEQIQLHQLERTDDISLFKGFYQTLSGKEVSPETLQILADALMDIESADESHNIAPSQLNRSRNQS